MSITVTNFEAISGGVAASLSVLTFGVVYARRLLKRTGNFLDDWNGEEERPGVARKPGVMERIQSIDTRLNRVEGQVTPNGGSSMADQVNHIVQQISNQDIATEANRTKDGLNE